MNVVNVFLQHHWPEMLQKYVPGGTDFCTPAFGRKVTFFGVQAVKPKPDKPEPKKENQNRMQRRNEHAKVFLCDPFASLRETFIFWDLIFVSCQKMTEEIRVGLFIRAAIAKQNLMEFFHNT